MDQGVCMPSSTACTTRESDGSGVWTRWREVSVEQCVCVCGELADRVSGAGGVGERIRK